MNWESKWPVISALAAVAALFVPLLLFVINRDSKELTVETVSRATPVDLTNPELSSLELTYKGAPVSRLTAVTIEVRNSGTRPIQKADFESPVVLRFQDPSNILAVTLSERAPQDLKPVITMDSTGVSFAPLLLNPGDRFRLTAQIRGEFNEPTVEARISGVRAVSRRVFFDGSRTNRLLGVFLMASGFIMVMAYFYLAGFTTPLGRRKLVVMTPLDAVVLTGYLGFASAVSLVMAAQLLNLSKIAIVSLIAATALVGVPVFAFAIWRSRRTRVLQNDIPSPQPR